MGNNQQLEKCDATGVTLKNTTLEWAGITTAGLISIWFWMHYLYIRSGWKYSLLTANKSIAITSVIFIAFSLILGPIARIFHTKKSLLRLRRPAGIVGTITVFLHIILSIFFLPEKFPLDYYKSNKVSMLVGIIAFVILLVATLVSNCKSFACLGWDKWKKIQRLSYIALGLSLLHFVMLNRLPYWLRWVKRMSPIYPPGALVCFVFGVAVIAVKIIEMFLNYTKQRTKRT